MDDNHNTGLISALACYLGGAFLGAAIGAMEFVVSQKITLINICLYVVYTTHAPSNVAAAAAYVTTNALIAPLLMWALQRLRPDIRHNHALIAAAPCALLLPLSCIPPSFPSIVIMILICGWSLYRISALVGVHGPAPQYHVPPWIDYALVGLATAVFVVYATIFQMRALDAGRLGYADWGIYVGAALNTLKGNYFFSNDIMRNYLGHHFMPGAILLLLPVVAFKSHWVIFIVNAAVLYGGAIAIHQIARMKKLGRTASLAFAFVYLLNPALSNMSFSKHYGFHTVYFTIPLIAIFFLLYERRRLSWAFAVFAFTLTINETVGFFWCGASLGLAAATSDRKYWAAVAACALLYSVTTITYVIPSISGLPSYEFSYRYANLGGSTKEIILSLFLHPLVPLKALLRPECVYYLSLLVIPLLWLVAARPFLLLTGGLIMLCVCLQVSSQLMVIPLQYHSEFLMYLHIVALYGLVRIREGRIPFFHKAAFYPFPTDKLCGSKCAGAALLATLFSTAFCFHLFSLAPWSKNTSVVFSFMPPLSPGLQKVEQIIPHNAPITATSFLAARYIFTYDVYPGGDAQDYVVMDLNEPFMPSQKVETLRALVLTSGRHTLVWSQVVNGHHMLLYAQGRPDLPDVTPPKPLVISDDRWARTGRAPVLWTEKDVTCRIIMPEPQDGLRDITLLFRLEEKLDHDIDIKLLFETDGSQSSSITVPFAHGVWPAFLLEKGSTFLLEMTVPLHSSLKLDIAHKPPPSAHSLLLSNEGSDITADSISPSP